MVEEGEVRLCFPLYVFSKNIAASISENISICFIKSCLLVAYIFYFFTFLYVPCELCDKIGLAPCVLSFVTDPDSSLYLQRPRGHRRPARKKRSRRKSSNTAYPDDAGPVSHADPT